MSRPRRRPNKASNTGKARKARNTGRARTPVDTFWGDTDDHPRTAEKIQPTADPAALPRSLGQPPLTPDTAARRHLTVVYEEAVRTATALAAASGLLQDDEPM